MSNKLEIAQAMIAAYNTQNADAYVAYMTEDASEAMYRGDVLRAGKEGVRTGLLALFEDYPENTANIIEGYQLGDHAVLYERVFRGAKVGETVSVSESSFEVISIYSFEGDKVSRVEFGR